MCDVATSRVRPLSAQCRFKMASVRDRYRGISVENVRICDVSGCGSARVLPWNLGACAPHPAPAGIQHTVRILTILRRHSPVHRLPRYG